MNVRTILSVAAVTSALAFSGFAVAQEEHIIGGKAVPADQIEAVEARCLELRSLATEAPALDDNDEMTSEPAGDVATPTPDDEAAAPAPAADVADDDDDDATGVWSGNIFNISDLTVDQCDEGKFAMQTTP